MTNEKAGAPVEAPMSDATFVYDDACGFCTWCAQLLVDNSDLDVVGFSEITDEETARLPDDWRSGAHLLTADQVYSNGAAIEEAFLRSSYAPDGSADVVGFLRQFDDYGRLREKLYQAAADRRDVWGLLASGEPPVRRE